MNTSGEGSLAALQQSKTTTIVGFQVQVVASQGQVIGSQSQARPLNYPQGVLTATIPLLPPLLKKGKPCLTFAD